MDSAPTEWLEKRPLTVTFDPETYLRFLYQRIKQPYPPDVSLGDNYFWGVHNPLALESWEMVTHDYECDQYHVWNALRSLERVVCSPVGPAFSSAMVGAGHRPSAGWNWQVDHGGFQDQLVLCYECNVYTMHLWTTNPPPAWRFR